MNSQSYKTLESSGFSLIEVLVTMLILMGGLLGLAGLQGVALTAQLEAFQRSQALVLVQDMADRINANRTTAATAGYVTTALTPAALGTGNLTADCAALAVGQARDSCEWSNALLGAAETTGGGTINVGAMIGARGCITQLVAAAPPVPAQYLIEVAWQGFNPTFAPSGTCGAGAYGAANLRRVVSLTVTIGNLGI